MVNALKNFAEVIVTNSSRQANIILRKQEIDLILIEIAPGSIVDVGIIRQMKQHDATVPIVAIFDSEEERDLIATAFSYNVKDAFRKQCEHEMIIERSKALLKILQES